MIQTCKIYFSSFCCLLHFKQHSTTRTVLLLHFLSHSPASQLIWASTQAAEPRLPTDILGGGGKRSLFFLLSGALFQALPTHTPLTSPLLFFTWYTSISRLSEICKMLMGGCWRCMEELGSSPLSWRHPKVNLGRQQAANRLHSSLNCLANKPARNKVYPKIIQHSGNI